MWQEFDGAWHFCHWLRGDAARRLIYVNNRCAPAVLNHRVLKRGTAMELILFVAFIALLALASAIGLTADTHDSADWKPTRGGFREPQAY